MNPRLIAIAGPRQGFAFPFIEGEMLIGRDASNWLFLADESASRRHCAIQKEGQNFKLNDLNSMNGTFVNEIPIQARVLQHGDRIVIGDSVFIFLTDEGEVKITDSAPMDEAMSLASTTVRLRMEDAYYLHPEKISTLSPSSRTLQNFSTLMKVSTAINLVQGLEALGKTLLHSIFEVIPAERCALLLLGEGQGEFICPYAAERAAGRVEPFPVSRTVLEQVVREGIALLSNDVLESEPLSKVQSLKLSHITSLIAVPLLLLNKILGVLYLDTTKEDLHFDEEHLQFMTAIAGIAAVSIENARHMEYLESEKKRLLAEINIAHNMIGESSRMRELYQLISKVAPSDSTVFIRGESGTGKELAAYAIHLNSHRSEKPFVVINCATLTETLLESELFGYEKGAFTGALAQRKGKLEVSDGGTVFLDEVAEISTALQTKLLRVLQEREFERVGGTRPIRIDVRFIAATNKDLEEAIKNSSFRQDLYYRLNVVSITMPPLKERREDIPLLATYFASKFSKESKRRVMGISPQARAALQDYDWPGNVRELENAIERAVVMGSGEMILLEDLPEALLESRSQSESTNQSYYDTVQELKREVILKALQQAKGNYNEAAKVLGIHTNNLHRLIRNLNLKALLNK